MTARKTGGMISPYKGMVPAAPKSANTTIQAYAIVALATPEGVLKFFYTYFINYFVSVFLFSYVFPYRCFIQSNCADKYPLAQKCLFPNLYFKFANLSNIMRALFPFKYPIILATLYLGGILTHM